MSKEIETAVAEILSKASVHYSARPVGETAKDGWKCDEWRVTLKGARLETTFEYFTGTGLRDKKSNRSKSPSAASVLYSLVLDGRAIDQSFIDWCDDFGSDPDSRKALQTYEACCESGRKLRLLFTREQSEALKTALQDY